MEKKGSNSEKEAKKSIASDRKRTNILRDVEHNTITYLVKRMPSWLSSDMLTGIGFLGNFMVFLSFIAAAYLSKYYLLIGVVGFFISWFGDSLDGRIAYYRNIPRKWYGFVLDITVDWLGILFIGLGFMFYVEEPWTYIGYGFVVLYGWEMITAILRYKITGKYSIDSGLLGPTEVRILISAMLILEVIFTGSIVYFGALAILVLVVVNILSFKQLLGFADDKDIEEKKKKEKND
jgi:hypothetical protein